MLTVGTVKYTQGSHTYFDERRGVGGSKGFLGSEILAKRDFLV